MRLRGEWGWKSRRKVNYIERKGGKNCAGKVYECTLHKRMHVIMSERAAESAQVADRIGLGECGDENQLCADTYDSLICKNSAAAAISHLSADVSERKWWRK